MAPVPVYVKGGVWSNVEDQILKAAIKKYGTHQWSKIASLLQKKSARQCEIRWKEYLNPTLNFTEFSKEEDIKLLNLAARLPNQWRTISDMMGRTAQACIERYNKLLTSSDNEDELSLATSLDFKIGDLNPHAETEAALPDKEVLDDDEREMLAEAKARLLNTQGKKASRKVRERLLEESKIVAKLQKRRELKQAGIKTGIKQGKKKYETEIDYNEDVVYEQAPLAGIYDTTEEDELMLKSLEKFHEKVDRKGLMNRDAQKIEKDGTKKNKGKRAREESNVPSNSSQIELKDNLFREGTENQLVLSKIGEKDIMSQDQEIALKRQKLLDSQHTGAVLGSKIDDLVPLPSENDKIENLKHAQFNKEVKKRLLVQLFQMLPKPKNDFDIVLEDDEENEYRGDTFEEANSLDVSHDDSDSSQTTEKVLTVPLSLDCLQNTGLTIPSLIENPQSNYDIAYNELVLNAVNGTEIKVPESHLKQMALLETEIAQIPSVDKEKYEPEPCTISLEKLKNDVLSKIDIVSDLQSNLNYINPLIERNDKLSRDLCGRKLPENRLLQTEYFVNYGAYAVELRGISERRQRLKQDIANSIKY